MIFNSDKYIDNKLAGGCEHLALAHGITPLKPPNNKVPATNLAKLAPDRKVV
jgi:hypothetical protein